MIFLLTSISVSIDAYLAGVALINSNSRYCKKVTISVVVYTFLMCVIGLLFAQRLTFLGDYFKIVGSIIFLCLGIKNIVKFSKNQNLSTQSKNLEIQFVGFAVGVDAAIACLSILTSGMKIVLYASLTAIFHGVFVYLGMKTAKLLTFIKSAGIIGGIFFIVLAIIKVL